MAMSQNEEQRLEAALIAAGGSPNRLAELFTSMKARLGNSAASRLWWGAFGAGDAAET
jgi:hypothetical protein